MSVTLSFPKTFQSNHLSKPERSKLLEERRSAVFGLEQTDKQICQPPMACNVGILVASSAVISTDMTNKALRNVDKPHQASPLHGTTHRACVSLLSQPPEPVTPKQHRHRWAQSKVLNTTLHNPRSGSPNLTEPVVV